MRLILNVSRYRTSDGREITRGQVFDVTSDVGEHMKRTGKASDAPPPRPRPYYRTRRLMAED